MSKYRSLKICLTDKNYCKIYEIEIEERNPLKQGLKLQQGFIFEQGFQIEERNPLKQGLKLNTPMPAAPATPIEERNPLKQGLKLLIGNDPLA